MNKRWSGQKTLTKNNILPAWQSQPILDSEYCDVVYVITTSPVVGKQQHRWLMSLVH